MTRPDEPRDKTGWWLAVPGVAVIVCCAGPALLAALGVGSVTAVVGGVIGALAITCAGLLLVIAVALVVRRRARR